jgi:hypothetical protein
VGIDKSEVKSQADNCTTDNKKEPVKEGYFLQNQQLTSKKPARVRNPLMKSRLSKLSGDA